MARTALGVTDFVPNGKVAQPAGTLGDALGHVISGVKAEEIVLRVVVATATSTLTIGAGAKPPSLESKAQAESLTVGTHFVGPFTSAQVTQKDGTINLDYGTPANTTVTVLRMPRTA